MSAGRSRAAPHSTLLVERKLPWLSERVSAVAAATFRSWMRAPEMKMTLLTPVIMLIAFTGMFASRSTAPELVRPLTAIGIATFMLVMGMVGPIGNQFGYDRSGFRALVLSPLPRRDVLLGKNLSLLPFALVMMVVAVGLSHWFNPMRFDHLLAVLVQLLPVYLVFCLAGNMLSILGPMQLRQGSGMPTRHQGVRAFYPLVFMLLVPFPLALTLVPLGLEAVFQAMHWVTWLHPYLVFGLLQALATIWVYRVALAWEGDLMQRREQEILQIVGSKAA